MQSEEKIRIKAMCLFHKNGKALVSKGFDRVKGERFYRVLGGGVNFFETGEAGVRREIQEELQSEIENLKFVDIIENLFTYEGSKGHEIIFLYSGDLSRKAIYKQNSIRIIEDTHEVEAEWVSTNDILEGKIPLYPVLDYKALFKNLQISQ